MRKLSLNDQHGIDQVNRTGDDKFVALYFIFPTLTASSLLSTLCLSLCSSVSKSSDKRVLDMF